MKKVSRFLSALLVVLLLFSGVVFAEGDRSEEPKEQELTEQEKEAIAETIRTLFEASTDKNRQVTIPYASQQVQQDTEARRNAFIEMETSIGAVFESVYHNTDIYRSDRNLEGNLLLTVHETVVFEYHYQSIADSVDIAAYGVWHELELKKTDGKWIVIRDSFDERGITGVASQDVADRSWGESNGVYIEQGHTDPDRNLSFSYNSTKLNTALQYAIQYCGLSETQRAMIGYTAWRDMTSLGANTTNYNPLYYSYENLGGDCCNFVSQIIYAAGAATDSYWYYYIGSSGLREGAPNWRGVQCFVDHFELSYTKSSVTSGNYSSVFPGNPIYWLAQNSNDHNHIMFCVGYNSAGVPVICCHTNDAYRMPITSGFYMSTSHQLYTIKIATYNMHSHSYIYKPCNSAVHYKICSNCEYIHSMLPHNPNAAGYCTNCGAQGPFIDP